MSQQGRRDGSDPGDRVRLIVGAVAALALVLFLLQNVQRAEIHFLWFDWTIRMMWALLLSAAFGAVATLAAVVLLRRPRNPRE